MTIVSLSIKNLRLNLIIGTQEKERLIKQPIFVTLDVSVQMTKPIQEDNIKGTLDYYELSQEIKLAVQGKDFFLIETLADFILNFVLKEEKVIEAQIELSKPNALIAADTVSVKIKKSR